MATTKSPYRNQLLAEIDKMPTEYLPALIKMMQAFREGVMLPSAEDSFRQGWQEVLKGETQPISELWEDIDAS